MKKPNNLNFEYNNKKYKYSSNTGYLDIKENAEEDIEGHFLQLPFDIRKYILNLIAYNQEAVINILKDIIQIYNESFLKGKESKQNEIKKALGIGD